MNKFDLQFKGYQVPERLKDTAIAIMQRFTIYGICDGMYICNKIAHTCGIGDGNGIFTGDDITEIHRVAEALQSAYGCNICKSDIEELEDIITTGKLNKEKAKRGIKKYISNCRKEMKTCDELRVDNLHQSINEAKDNLRLIS